MKTEVTVKWNPGVYDKLTKGTPDRIMYDIAAKTLLMVFPTIPERTGKMKQSSLARGVQGSNLNYHIGSYTDYASYVYEMPDRTHWTTPGTNAEWFIRTWQKSGKSIVADAIGRNKLK